MNSEADPVSLISHPGWICTSKKLEKIIKKISKKIMKKIIKKICIIIIKIEIIKTNH